MASPFSVFRKNQKFMIASAGLFAIFAFVFKDQNSGDNETGYNNACQLHAGFREAVSPLLKHVALHLQAPDRPGAGSQPAG